MPMTYVTALILAALVIIIAGSSLKRKRGGDK